MVQDYERGIEFHVCGCDINISAGYISEYAQHLIPHTRPFLLRPRLNLFQFLGQSTDAAFFPIYKQFSIG